MMAIKLFFSYSHIDEQLRDQLEVHLSALKHQGAIDTWHDRRIYPGDVFDDEISIELEEAGIILLLISADFIASSYCYGREASRALDRHTAGAARVIPVILRPCDWHDLPFGRLLALPTDGRPITRWENIDDAFLNVVQGIKKVLVDSEPTRSTPKDLVLQSEKRQMKQQGVFGDTRAIVARSSNLRVAKTFTDRDRDDFLHDAFAYLANFFENSLNELSRRNPGIDGRLRRSGNTCFVAAIYRGGNKVTACTVYVSRRFGTAAIQFSYGENDTLDSFNESLCVDHDDQKLFLKPMGMMGFGNQGSVKLSMQGGAELFWGELIRPVQGN